MITKLKSFADVEDDPIFIEHTVYNKVFKTHETNYYLKIYALHFKNDANDINEVRTD